MNQERTLTMVHHAPKQRGMTFRWLFLAALAVLGIAVAAIVFETVVAEPVDDVSELEEDAWRMACHYSQPHTFLEETNATMENRQCEKPL